MDLDLHERVQRGLERYEPLLPWRAIRRFHRVAAFLIEAHPAAFHWTEVLRRSAAQEALPIPNTAALPAETKREIPESMLVGLLESLGVRRPGSSPEGDVLTEVALDEAEAASRLVVDMSFPAPTEASECSRALDRFIDLTFATLFAGLIGALLRRHEQNRDELDLLVRELGPSVLITPLLAKQGRDARTFELYVVHALDVEAVAARLGHSVTEEKAHILSFLERVVVLVEEEGGRIVREVKVDNMALTPSSAPWAASLAGRELTRSRAEKSKKRS